MKVLKQEMNLKLGRYLQQDCITAHGTPNTHTHTPNIEGVVKEYDLLPIFFLPETQISCRTCSLLLLLAPCQ